MVIAAMSLVVGCGWMTGDPEIGNTTISFLCFALTAGIRLKFVVHGSIRIPSGYSA
jgi:hypothetical protein